MAFDLSIGGRGFPLYFWQKETPSRDSLKEKICSSLEFTKNLNSNLAHPEQPAYTVLIGKGKAKLVYSGYRKVSEGAPASKIEGVAYLISRERFAINNELREEVKDGKRIKNGVYLANLRLWIESLGEEQTRAKLSAAILIQQFPTIEAFIQGIQTEDPRLKRYIEKSAEKDPESRSLERLLNSCLHLAVDLVDAPHIVIQHKPAVIAKMAQNDLESAVRRTRYPFPESAKLALQIMKGFRELHAGGFVHGDIKLENALVYDLNGVPLVKLADWGKCEKLGKNEAKLHTGNRRHMAPERLSSQKGEVFGVAIMAIRILEEEFLTSPKEMLTQPIEKDSDKEKRLQEEESPAKCRKGIERFLSIGLDCPEEDSAAKGAISHAIFSVLSYLRKKPEANIDAQLNKYLYALQTHLENRYGTNQKTIRELISVLRSMTRSNPKERISMEEAVPKFEACLKKLQA